MGYNLGMNIIVSKILTCYSLIKKRKKCSNDVN